MRHGPALLAALLLTLAVVQAFLPATAFPFAPLDEPDHFAYATDLRIRHRWWPDFDDFPFRDEAGRDAGRSNYINHPPLFYWFVAALQALAPLPPAWAVLYRALPLLLFALTIHGYLRTLKALRLDGASGMLFMAVPLGLMVWATAPFVNNDAMGLAGGALAVWGSAGLDRRGSRGLMLVGLALASAKLNEFLLVSVYCAGMVAFTPWRNPSEGRRTAAIGALASGVLALPFVALWIRYGSPAPETPGQIRLLRDLAVAQGGAERPRMGAAAFVVQSLIDFSSAMGGGVLFVATSAAVAVGLLTACDPFGARPASTLTLMARSAAIATGLTLAVHLTASYRRHLNYGIMADMYPRYYFPLLGAYAAAAVPVFRRCATWIRASLPADAQSRHSG